MLAGSILLLISGIAQGSFGLGYKKYTPLSWEAFWAVYSILWLGLTIIWIGIEVPEFMSFINSMNQHTLMISVLCGFFWGMTGICFGKAVDGIGVSLTYGVSMGISAVVGGILPLFGIVELPPTRTLVILGIGSVVTLIGIGVITRAGLLKDKEQSTGSSNKLVIGLILAIVSGLGAAGQNVGFTYAKDVSTLAIQGGISPIAASTLPWIIVLVGGFISNCGYAVFKLCKNKTFHTFYQNGAYKQYPKLILTAFIWLLALMLYGKAAYLLGTLGTVIGWLIFNALALVVSTGWGVKTGEWKGAQKSKRVLMWGNIILTFSWVIIMFSDF